MFIMLCTFFVMLTNAHNTRNKECNNIMKNVHNIVKTAAMYINNGDTFMQYDVSAALSAFL